MRQYLQSATDAVKEARWLTRGRLLGWGSFCAFITIGVIALNVPLHSAAGLTDAAGEHAGRDFYGLWSDVLLAAGGRPDAAYVVGPHHTVDQALPYPPILLLLCWPLAGLSYAHALLVWVCLGLALYAWSLSRLVGWEMAVFATIGTPAALLNIFIGQNGYYTSVLLASGVMLVERRPVSAGILLGMLCFKPQLGIMVAVALVAGRYWRVLAVAAATALVLAAASAILLGPDAWIGFFYRGFLQRHLMEIRGGTWFWMPTVFAMIRLLGAGSSAAYLVQGISTISAAIAVAALWRGNGLPAVKSAGLVVATFLATPYAWYYDAIVLTFAAAWLANEAVKTGFLPWEKITVFILLTLPALSLGPARLLNLQIAPILLWLTMAVVMRRGLRARFLSTPALLSGEAG